MQLDDIKKLAIMARVDMDEAEMLEIANSFDSILAYVGQIQEVSESTISDRLQAVNTPFNIMREDVVTNKPGEYTQKIIGQMPDSQDGFLKVKQIL
ncbi:MAG: Asp-tRNA(Asn)/Glu-tRNA(Gln) amidotransferase subunit GatC [Patescibacteria group bacterium]